MQKLVVGVLVGLALIAGGCGGDDAATSPSSTRAAEKGSTTTAPRGPIRILVTNDDGIGAEGIAFLADALAAQDGVVVTVVAPAENQSGSGGKTTVGEVTVTDAVTASGRAGKAVAGFPADAVIWALDGKGVTERPDLVISGVNNGQNIGPAVPISGTIGAARAAASRGIPALAVSQGVGEPPDFATGVRLAVEWFESHRVEIAAATLPLGVTSLNVPTCTAGEARGPVTVPVGQNADGRDLSKSDCTGPDLDPADDVTGFTSGYATLSEVGLG